jgi:hypothetical protein
MTYWSGGARLIFPTALQAGVPGWVDILSRIAIIFVALVLIVLSVVLIVVMIRLLRLVRDLPERLRPQVAPLLGHATSIAGNVDQVTTAIRDEVQTVRQTVQSTNQRVNRIAALAEERVRELNALLAVVQEEAEDLFVETASTLRGMRAGREALGRLGEDEEHDGLDEELDDESGDPYEWDTPARRATH